MGTSFVVICFLMRLDYVGLDSSFIYIGTFLRAVLAKTKQLQGAEQDERKVGGARNRLY